MTSKPILESSDITTLGGPDGGQQIFQSPMLKYSLFPAAAVRY